MKNVFKLLVVFLIAAIISGCSQEPQPIEYDKDSCTHCMMLITDAKYGAELITTKGKCFKFDAVECLAQYILENKADELDNASLWITDFTKPSHFINAKTAFYLQNEKFHSPMGFNVLAVEDENELKKIKDEHGGKELNWEKLVELV